MIFTAPLGLLALAAIPAIVAIHMFRRRFPDRPIAGLFLWHVIQQVPESGGRINKLPITASLILECLAALALALILAGARFNPSETISHLVVLLDDSASMAAVNARGESARDRAIRRVMAEADRLGRSGRISIIQSGDRPSVLLGPAALIIQAQPALERWKPEARHHSLSSALRLARELAGPTGRLMIVTDGPESPRGDKELEGVLRISVGEPLPNVGIIDAARTLTPKAGAGAIALTLRSSSGSPERRRLKIEAGDKEIFARDLEVASGVSSLTLPLPTGLGPVEVTLSPDPLDRDNTVTLVEPNLHIVGVENRLPPGRGKDALAKALTSLSGVILADQGHLAFEPAARFGEPSPPGQWRVGFGTPPPRFRAPGEGTDFLGPFVPEKRHPLLDGVTLAGVVWTGAVPLAAEAGAYPIVSAGDRTLIAILGARPESGIFFNLDMDRTNLIRATDWPILISNIVEMRRQSLPGPDRWNVRVGEWVRVRLAAEPKGPVRLRSPGVDRPLPTGRLLEFIAPAPGGLLEILDGETVLYQLGVNFLDTDETQLADRASAELGRFAPETSPLHAESGPESDPLFWTLLAIGGLAVVGNWCLLGRRSGVRK